MKSRTTNTPHPDSGPSRSAFQEHLRLTEEHVIRLEKIVGTFGLAQTTAVLAS